MTDLQILREIETKIDVPFRQQSLEELVKDPTEPRRGYSLDNSGNVIGLRLNNTCFSDGELLGKLESITTLFLCFNDIHDFGFLKQLKKLDALHLSAPFIKDFSFLSELTGLRTLALRKNRIIDGSFLGGLRGLVALDLSSNNITDGSFLKDLKGLSSLDLSSNNITDFSFLKDLKGLSSLDLRSNKITDGSFLKDLKGLSSLNLTNNNITDGSFLKDLKGLSSLNLTNNNITDFSFLKDLKGLSSLDLRSNNITDGSFLKDLKGLSSLDLSYNNITDASVLKELKGLTSLDLSYNKIIDASFLKELKGLTSLDLSYNNITDASFLKELKGLSSLDLSNNNITDFSFLKELKVLSSLHLNSYNITDFSFLKELKVLSSLHLSNNNITDFSFLKELNGLSSLDLSNNNITDFSFLKELKGLSSLGLSSNNITDLSFLKEFKGLSSLYLRSNNITDLSFLKELKGLSSLYLSTDNITDLSFLKELKGLSWLNLNNSKIATLFPILDTPNLITVFLFKTTVSDLPENYRTDFISDTEPIRSYYRERSKKIDTLYEAKVLFVGEPEAGKTSLMKRLSIPGYKIDPQKKELSTLGITIHWDWTFDAPNPHGKPFKAHLWDFGGQQIQYYIHQFFLTEDALYVLVIDDRKEAPNIDYWFRIIHLLGKESPVLVVRNRKNIDAATGFDWNKYATRYKEDFRVLEYEDIDLVNQDNRFYCIEDRIKALLTGLEHIGRELPASWLGIRQSVIDVKERNYITVAEFKAICAKYELAEEADQLAICTYLNTLGILLHFRNDAALAGTVFVNPQWISKAVYAVLSDRDIEETHGRFEQSQLFDKWGNDYSFEEKSMLLTLMQKSEFDLVYRVDSRRTTETYIAPILLSDVAPGVANSWERKGTLCFRYRYKFMPVGIITRLIVRLNDFIETTAAGGLVWKSGVILAKDGCRALVKSDLSSEGLNIIDISIAGDRLSAKDFLAHIRATIDAVHQQSFKEMDVELLVPCTCPVCRDDKEPYMFEFSRLRGYINAGKFEILCEKEGSFQNVEIEELLGGVVVHRHVDFEFRHHDETIDRMPSQREDKLAECLTEITREALRQKAPPAQLPEKGWPKWLKTISIIIGILVGITALYKFYDEFIAKKSIPSTKNHSAIQTVPLIDSQATSTGTTLDSAVLKDTATQDSTAGSPPAVSD